MRKMKKTILALGAGGLVAVTGANAAGATDALASESAPTGTPETVAAPSQEGDPAVIASRDALSKLPPAGEAPLVQPHQEGVLVDGAGVARVNEGKTLSGWSYTGGYVEVGANDWAAGDSPGWVTTTMRVYGNAAAWRTGNGKIKLTSQFTCTGAGISGLSIGASGVSVSGGATSSTLTWDSTRTNSPEVRQFYDGDGHFRCKASNLSFAKTTRRAIGTASYKTADTRAQGEYSFWW
jgi:hypothetical protein